MPKLGGCKCPEDQVDFLEAASLRSERHDVAVQATGHITAGPATFLVTLALDARESGRRVHSRQWHLEFPRNGT